MTLLHAPDYPVLSADDFFDMDFGMIRAELDNGVVRIVSEREGRADRIAAQTLLALAEKLNGSTFQVFTKDRAIVTCDTSVRFPDISVGPRDPPPPLVPYRPRVLFELHEGRTARTDLRVKLEEYKALASVDTIVFVDIASERLRVLQRTGPHGWSDVAHDAPFDVPLPALGVTLPHVEMFARD